MVTIFQRSLVLASVLSTCSAAPGGPREPARAATTRAGDILIWGGGKTRDRAEASLAVLKRAMSVDKSGKARWIWLAEGFPKIVDSDSIAGLNPGFVVVVLGYCDDTNASEAALEWLRAVEPRVYKRRINSLHAPACPLPPDDLELVDIQEIELSKDFSLSVAVAQGGEYGYHVPGVAVLRKKRELVEINHFELGEGCVGAADLEPELSRRGKTITASFGCEVPGCTDLGFAKHAVKVTVDRARKLAVKDVSKLVRPGECD